jgi:hypothetical protein
MKLQHSFVQLIPDQLEDGVLYISTKHSTAIHKCVCGCNNEVVTPLSPTDWQLTFDGESVSLNPSIGNWSFKCKSHYWIVKDTIKMARKWSDDEIRIFKDITGADNKEVAETVQSKNSSLWDLLSKYLKTLL